MNKGDEWEQLTRVFGAGAKHAREFEQPDFLLATSSGSSIGVEVTTLYSSNSDAKLKRLDGYSDGLIDKTQRVHRSDISNLHVDELTILNPDGSVVDTVTGIAQRHPSPKDQVRLLFERIAEKEAKVNEYLRSCDQVDLVVTDESHLFHHASPEDFYKLYPFLIPRRRLLSTPFREIYLVTTTHFQNRVFIPLVSNALACDCLAYEHVLQDELAYGLPDQEIFPLMTASLLHDGYARLKVIFSEEGTGFLGSAWEMFYGDRQTACRDWMLPHITYPGKPIADVVAAFPGDLIQKARRLTTKKKRWFAAVNMRLPTREA